MKLSHNKTTKRIKKSSLINGIKFKNGLNFSFLNPAGKAKILFFGKRSLKSLKEMLCEILTTAGEPSIS